MSKWFKKKDTIKDILSDKVGAIIILLIVIVFFYSLFRNKTCNNEKECFEECQMYSEYPTQCY